jgi:hypothetical protein
MFIKRCMSLDPLFAIFMTDAIRKHHFRTASCDVWSQRIGVANPHVEAGSLPQPEAVAPGRSLLSCFS